LKLAAFSLIAGWRVAFGFECLLAGQIRILGSNSMKQQHKGHDLQIPSLDGFRAFAILVVVVAHSGYALVVPGGLGVTVFFFLSGFLITTLLLREFDAVGTINIRQFYVRRFLRLGPPLLITLAVAYGLYFAGFLPGKATWTGFLAQLFYFSNYHIVLFDGGKQIPFGTDVLWSLAVEEHFYLAFPLLLLFLLMNLSRRSILVALVALCILTLVWRYHLAAGEQGEFLRTYYGTDTRIDSILYGCILALITHPLQLNEAPNRFVGYAGIGAGAILLLFSVVYRDPEFRNIFRYSVQGLALMPIFYFAITLKGSLVHKILNLAFVKRIGVYSYAIYLCHFVFIQVIFHKFPELSHPAGVLVLALITSVAYAAVIDTWIEPYFRHLRHRYRYEPNDKTQVLEIGSVGSAGARSV
jgi:peptidoglycan/LPS O-acetylase OafA/YrhL